MKKRFLSLLCVLLSLMMVLPSVNLIAYAKQKPIPVIVIHGLGGSDLYQDKNDGNTKIAQFGLDVKAMAGNTDILEEAIKLFTDTQKPDYDRLFSALGEYFTGTKINYNANGSPQGNSGVRNYWTDPLSNHKEYLTMRDFSIPVMARQISDIIGAKNVYAFNYDWRADMCESADKLRSLVVNVKKRTKSKKVTIVALSLGGAVVSAYMDKYKNYKDVARYILINPAYQGVDVARAFGMDLTFNKNNVIPYLKHMEQAYQAGEKETLFRAITALGDYRIGVGLDKINKDIMKNSARRKQFFLEVVKPWIGNIPTFYELIPYAQFDSTVKTLVNMGYLDKNTGLYKKIQNYHKVQGRFRKNLKAVKKAGAEVAIIANYGTKALPFTSKLNNHSDLLIDTKYASVGATVAQYGKKLKGKNAKGANVSKDKIINARTCALPNNTWFIKGIIHGLYKYNGEASKMIARLATGKVKCNVKAYKKKYKKGQFLKADQAQNLKNS